MDNTGKTVNIYSDALKEHIRNGILHVENLTLTSDNRLVNAGEEGTAKSDQLESIVSKAKMLGKNIIPVPTSDGHNCIVVELEKNKLKLLIPDEVTEVAKSSHDTLFSSSLGNIICEHGYDNTELEVIGGRGLKSTLNMFLNLTLNILDLTKLDTSNVTNMVSMFEKLRVGIIKMGNFNTSKVTNMASMFYCCKIRGYNRSLYSDTVGILDLSSFDTSNVENMTSMFNRAVLMADFSKLNTSKVKSMQSMFEAFRARSMTLNTWDTSCVKYFNGMFSKAVILKLSIKSFKVKDKANTENMFSEFNGGLETTDHTIKQAYYRKYVKENDV